MPCRGVDCGLVLFSADHEVVEVLFEEGEFQVLFGRGAFFLYCLLGEPAEFLVFYYLLCLLANVVAKRVLIVLHCN